jgi:hypothetical protein
MKAKGNIKKGDSFEKNILHFVKISKQTWPIDKIVSPRADLKVINS